MYLIVGLGNPGIKYEFTRHNVGFLAIDIFLQKLETQLKSQSEQNALVYKTKLFDQPILLAKPQTYMNLSGESVRGLMAFYKIPLKNLLVIHDDIDQNFLSVKFQKNSSHGGQNGVKNIQELMGTEDFTRLKLGLGRPQFENQSVSDHVLQKFSDFEESFIGEWMDYISQGIECFIKNGYEKSANLFNVKFPKASDLIEKKLISKDDFSKNNFYDLLDKIKPPKTKK